MCKAFLIGPLRFENSMTMMRLVAAVLISTFFSANGLAGYSYNMAGSTDTVDFAGFQGTGFTPAPSPGQLSSNEWSGTGALVGDILFGSTVTTGFYAAGTSATSVTTPGVYAFSSTPGASAANPSLGIQSYNSPFNVFEPGSMTFQLTNNTGSPIGLSGGTVGYDVFVRNDAATSSSLTFSYAQGTLNTPGTFTTPGGIDTVTSVAAAGPAGWTTGRSVGSLTNLILGSVAPGDSIFFRWTQVGLSGLGEHDEFAIDNIAFNFTAVPEPTTLGSLMTLFGVWVFRRKRKQKEQVQVVGEVCGLF
jgi:hypothetical protein